MQGLVVRVDQFPALLGHLSAIPVVTRAIGDMRPPTRADASYTCAPMPLSRSRRTREAGDTGPDDGNARSGMTRDRGRGEGESQGRHAGHTIPEHVASPEVGIGRLRSLRRVARLPKAVDIHPERPRDPVVSAQPSQRAHQWRSSHQFPPGRDDDRPPGRPALW